jgi:Flp pilus assembly protein TadG
MIRDRKQNNKERGASLVEFAIAATVFLTVVFAVVEFGRALWVHNALSDAARRGARYAVLHKATDIEDVKKIVVYGDLTETTPLLDNLTTGNVDVVYNGFNLDGGMGAPSLFQYMTMTFS